MLFYLTKRLHSKSTFGWDVLDKVALFETRRVFLTCIFISRVFSVEEREWVFTATFVAIIIRLENTLWSCACNTPLNPIERMVHPKCGFTIRVRGNSTCVCVSVSRGIAENSDLVKNWLLLEDPDIGGVGWIMCTQKRVDLLSLPPRKPVVDSYQ